MLFTSVLASLSTLTLVLAAPAVTRRDYTLLNTIPWTLRSFNRTCTPTATIPAVCYYGFWVDTSQDEFATLGSPTCSFGVQGPADSSWAGLACGKSFNVSWGYQVANPQWAGGDGAVLTVVDSETIAWFGINSVNKKTEFGDIGPSPVYGCGQAC